jgi:hypothetical protein
MTHQEPPSGRTNTRGLSRREHLQTKVEAAQTFNAEERRWAREVLNDRELDESLALGCWALDTPRPLRAGKERAA